MHKMKGGVDMKDYKIEDVLGSKLKQFTTIMGQHRTNFEPFLLKNMDPKASIGFVADAANATPNDISYEFTQYIIAASAAFGIIEKPDVRRSSLLSETVDNLNKIFDIFIDPSIKALTPNTSLNKLEFNQLPYQHNNKDIQFLLPGFHVFDYSGDIYPTFSDRTDNAFVLLIRYLYHFIALLDTNNLNARTVIDFLSQDNLTFNKYLNETIKLFRYPNVVYPDAPDLSSISENNVRNAILMGLTAVAEQIINKFNKLTPSNINVSNLYKVIESFDGKPGVGNNNENANVKKFVHDLGVDTSKVDDIASSMKNIKSASSIDTADKTALALTDDQIKLYIQDGLYNPIYLDNSKVAETVNADIFENPEELASSASSSSSSSSGTNKGKPGGKIFSTSRTNVPTSGTGLPPSLEFLYGPRYTDSSIEKRSLITYNYQGDKSKNKHPLKAKSNIVANANVSALKLYVDNLKQLDASPSTADYSKNPIRAALLGLLNYYIKNNVDFPDTYDLSSDIDVIRKSMKNAVETYKKIDARLKIIPGTDIKGPLTEIKKAFVNEFALTIGETFTRPPNAPTDKNNLTVPEIKNFYNKYVAVDPFYNTFFNLIHDTNGIMKIVPIDQAVDKSDSELSKYRLNVKKIEGYSLLSAQVGGQGRFGDIVFVTYVPDFNSDVGGLWISKTKRIPHEELEKIGPEALRNIVRTVYSDISTDPKFVVIYGEQVNPKEVIARVSRFITFPIDYKSYYKSIMDRAISGTEFKITPRWVSNENMLKEHVLRSLSDWVREGDVFVRKGPNGEIIDENTGDACSLINIVQAECLQFLDACARSDSATFPEACKEMFDFDFMTNFEKNPSINDLKDQVVKINPMIAFEILNKFRFGSYLQEEPVFPFKGFRRFKVQSVGDWLRELFEGNDRCSKPSAPIHNPCNPIPLREQLGEVSQRIMDMAGDPKYYPFFNYLDMLVEWVNANPQVLNKEEDRDPGSYRVYPKVDDSYNTYDYISPYKVVYGRLQSRLCGLERLKANIANEISGSNAHSVISNITGVPLGIEMPLNRSMFTYPTPYYGVTSSIAIGGATNSAVYGLEEQLQSINYGYGYRLFNSIYEELLNVMQNMTKTSTIGQRDKSCNGPQRTYRSIHLKNESKMEIENKLEKFRKLEEDLRKQLVSLVKKNQLYQASRGYVNPYKVPDEDFESVLKKHSNLLNLSAAYNKRAINLIDVFQTISKAIISKLEENNPGVGMGVTTTNGSLYGIKRPMSMNY